MQFGYFSFVGDEAVMHAQPGCPDLLTILCKLGLAAKHLNRLAVGGCPIAHEAWLPVLHGCPNQPAAHRPA